MCSVLNIGPGLLQRFYRNGIVFDDPNKASRTSQQPTERLLPRFTVAHPLPRRQEPFDRTRDAKGRCSNLSCLSTSFHEQTSTCESLVYLHIRSKVLTLRSLNEGGPSLIQSKLHKPS